MPSLFGEYLENHEKNIKTIKLRISAGDEGDHTSQSPVSYFSQGVYNYCLGCLGFVWRLFILLARIPLKACGFHSCLLQKTNICWQSHKHQNKFADLCPSWAGCLGWACNVGVCNVVIKRRTHCQRNQCGQLKFIIAELLLWPCPVVVWNVVKAKEVMKMTNNTKKLLSEVGLTGEGGELPFIYMITRVSGNVKDLVKQLFRSLEPLNFSIEARKIKFW